MAESWKTITVTHSQMELYSIHSGSESVNINIFSPVYNTESLLFFISTSTSTTITNYALKCTVILAAV